MTAIVAASAGLLLAAAFGALWLRDRHRFRALEHEIAGVAINTPPIGEGSLEQTLAMRREELTALRAQAELARTMRIEAEQLVAHTDVRIALALQGAQDGLWEWNLVTGEAWYSAAWKNLLGYADGEIGSGFGEWLDRVHPDERAMIERSLEEHLKGVTPRLEVEHRLQHRDGSWRWTLARAVVLRNEARTTNRLVGLKTDIGARRESVELVLDIADGLSILSGRDCCAALVRRLAEIVGAPEAFLCVCADRPATRVRMLAHWTPLGDADLEEFELEGTPCREVIEQARTVFVPRGVKTRWPNEYAECGTEAYLGLPCIDTEGRVIGHIACKSRSEMNPDLPHQAVLKLFALRAAVELERFCHFRVQAEEAAA